MKDRAWAKNLLFLSLILGGISTLTLYLMASDRIEQPRSFAPQSRQRIDIQTVANRVDAGFEAEWALK